MRLLNCDATADGIADLWSTHGLAFSLWRESSTMEHAGSSETGKRFRVVDQPRTERGSAVHGTSLVVPDVGDDAQHVQAVSESSFTNEYRKHALAAPDRRRKGRKLSRALTLRLRFSDGGRSRGIAQKIDSARAELPIPRGRKFHPPREFHQARRPNMIGHPRPRRRPRPSSLRTKREGFLRSRYFGRRTKPFARSSLRETIRTEKNAPGHGSETATAARLAVRVWN